MTNPESIVYVETTTDPILLLKEADTISRAYAVNVQLINEINALT